MTEVVFIDAAIDDLRRLGPDIVPKVLKKVLLLCADPEAGQPLAGALTGYRKLVVGRNHWRIIYRVAEDGVLEICEIWCVGARSDAEVYREATARAAAFWVFAAFLPLLAIGGLAVTKSFAVRDSSAWSSVNTSGMASPSREGRARAWR